MKTAGDMVAAHNQEVWSISPNATVFEALKVMSDKNIGAFVRDAGKGVVGIVSKEITRGRSSSCAYRGDLRRVTS
jgi:CBS domain-containing protein